MAIHDNSPVKFYFTTSGAYHFIDPKEDNAIYYLTDTNELMIGQNSITIKSLKMLEITDAPSKGIDVANKDYVDNHSVVVDSELNSESENPVQNKVVTSNLNSKLSKYGGDTMYGSLYMNSNNITGIYYLSGNTLWCNTGTVQNDPSDDKHMVNKKYMETYVDTKIGDINAVLATLTDPQV